MNVGVIIGHRFNDIPMIWAFIVIGRSKVLLNVGVIMGFMKSPMVIYSHRTIKGLIECGSDHRFYDIPNGYLLS